MAQPNTQTQQNNTHKHIKNTSDTATDTSTCSTLPSREKKLNSSVAAEKKPIQLRIKGWQDIENVLQGDVTVACRPFAFRPQKHVYPFLKVVRKLGLSVNAVLNEALVFYFDAYAKDSCLRDDVRLAQLCSEEQKLVRLNKLMLRSGAYLDSYAEKVLKGGVRDLDDSKLGRKPLAALSKVEEPIFKRMVARREAIVNEVLEILDRKLPQNEYVLKEKRQRSQSKRFDKTQLRKECADSEKKERM